MNDNRRGELSAQEKAAAARAADLLARLARETRRTVEERHRNDATRAMTPDEFDARRLAWLAAFRKNT